MTVLNSAINNLNKYEKKLKTYIQISMRTHIQCVIREVKEKSFSKIKKIEREKEREKEERERERE